MRTVEGPHLPAAGTGEECPPTPGLSGPSAPARSADRAGARGGDRFCDSRLSRVTVVKPTPCARGCSPPCCSLAVPAVRCKPAKRAPSPLHLRRGPRSMARGTRIAGATQIFGRLPARLSRRIRPRRAVRWRPSWPAIQTIASVRRPSPFWRGFRSCQATQPAPRPRWRKPTRAEERLTSTSFSESPPAGWGTPYWRSRCCGRFSRPARPWSEA